jgi:hypothetical protein
MTTSHISCTDARRDYLRTVADCIERGVEVSPWIARDAAAALRDLADQHDRYVATNHRCYLHEGVA